MRADGVFGLCASTPRDQARRNLARAFVDCGIPSADLDARVLLCAALEIDHAGLVRDPDAPLGDGADILERFAARRLRREPVSRIIGYKEFCGERFALSSAVLDPRPDTETLIDAVLARVSRDSGASLRILDLGVGSGAILCALLSRLPNAFGVGVDLSPGACAIAQRNLAALRLGSRGVVVCGNWATAFCGRFDLIVSNPPYIPHGDIAGLAPDVRNYDPHLALSGGADGLDAYRALIRAAAALLSRDGAVALEIGPGQGKPVAALLRAGPLSNLSFWLDLNGRQRVILAERP